MAIPIPNRASGFTLGEPNANVKIDVFFDIQCPHSRTFWPTVTKLLSNYEKQSFSVTAHLITVSNHHQAWVMSLALMAVARGNAERFYEFVSYLFDHQDQFMNSEFRHKTHEDQRQLAAQFAQNHASIEPKILLELLDDHEVYIQARTPIRYAATRGVWATPTTFINNADDIKLSFRSPADEWIELIDSILVG